MQVTLDGFNSTGPDDEQQWVTWDLDGIRSTKDSRHLVLSHPHPQHIHVISDVQSFLIRRKCAIGGGVSEF